MYKKAKKVCFISCVWNYGIEATDPKCWFCVGEWLFK